jgi:hypothetical protein
LTDERPIASKFWERKSVELKEEKSERSNEVADLSLFLRNQ